MWVSSALERPCKHQKYTNNLKIYNRYVCSVHTVALMRTKGTEKELSPSNAATDTSLTMTTWSFTNSLSAVSSSCAAFFAFPVDSLAFSQNSYLKIHKAGSLRGTFIVVCALVEYIAHYQWHTKSLQIP